MIDPKSSVLQTTQNEMLEWAENPRNRRFQFEDARQNILEHLPCESRLDFANISSSLEKLSSWHGTVGSLRVLRGDAGGWSEIQECLYLSFWSIKILASLHETNRRTTRRPIIFFDTPAICLVHAIAMGDHKIAELIGNRMLQALDDESFGPLSRTPFLPFTIKLFALFKQLPLTLEGRIVGDIPAASLGVYENIFKNWNDLSELGTALIAACDYHLGRIEEIGDEIPEFCDYPYRIFPAEIIAVLRVRQSLHLGIPEINRNCLASYPVGIGNGGPSVCGERS